MKSLLDHDFLTGVSTYHHYDHATKVTTIETVQDVQPYIEMNKKLHNTDYQRKGIKDEWMHAATIPIGIQMKWLKEHNVDIYKKEDGPKMMRLLDDPEYKYLKTGSCKL